jgi:lipopolysaccharide/colanic/teichoic acid biosynthesis glycosyltransferase
MLLKKWAELPKAMQNERVRRYYVILRKKPFQLMLKRWFDFILAFVLIIVLLPVYLLIAMIIKLDSKGPVLFRQVRVTTYGKQFRIFKFRTMVQNSEALGTQVTTKNDMRVTKAGHFLRKYRLDELPQLFNIVLGGDMSFVGTRPEVPRYVEKYNEEMMATLLMPAGITSEASIRYKDEEKLLYNADDADLIYVRDVLPEKMKYNLVSIEKFSLLNDFKTMLLTFLVVFR